MVPQRNALDASVCVEGSTARWLMPDSDDLQEESPQHRRLRRKITISIDPLAVLGTLVALALLGCMVVGLIQVHRVNQEIRQVQTELSTLRSRNCLLQAQYERGYDLQEIYAQARELGMIPMGQAEHTAIHIPLPEPVEELPWWEQWWMDFLDLFAYP